MKPRPPKSALRAARKGSRDAEIEMFGHPLPHHKPHRSKKDYDRKTAKARLKKGEPFLLLITALSCEPPNSPQSDNK